MIGQSISHYRIIEKIGAGGMGVVYRAHDEQLDRDVALKVLPAGTLADEAARKQFRKEALALAKLNHPNIETVYEFASVEGVDFLAMELIPGRPLNERIKAGALTRQEIVPLAMQFADGLAAAHEQGVIHRDLKPANLFVTPDGRLKILDFGLAKLVHPEVPAEVTLTTSVQSGTVSGTLPYMSPEQLRGLPVDARSDIYAAGAVLYEMATGQRPFLQTQGAELIGAILHQTPAEMRTVNPGVSPGLENVISKSLDKDPAKRYQSARELRAALDGLGSASGTPVHPGAATEKQSSVRRRASIAAGIAALAVVLLVGLLLGLNVQGMRARLWPRKAPEVVASSAVKMPVRMRKSVAVLGFKNLSQRPDEAWLSTALAEMLTTELSVGGKLRTIPGENVAQMKVNLRLPDADSYGKETLTRIQRNLGSDVVVLGSYLALGNGEVRVDVRIEDAATGEIADAVSKSGKESQVAELAAAAGAALRRDLGAGELSPDEAAAVKAALPSNTEAARFYSQGLDNLRKFDNVAARDALEKAVAADASFAFGHAALAIAWNRLGYAEKAKQETKKAVELSGGLSLEERLWIEGQYDETVNDGQRAIEIYKTLQDSYPDNLEYGLRLANAQAMAGKANDALATIEALRKLPLPTSADPRIDDTEATAADALGDYKMAIKADLEVERKGQAQGATLLVARALADKCWALQMTGQAKDAMPACERARDMFADTGEKAAVASVLTTIGAIQANKGNYPSARTSFEKALAIQRETGDRLTVSRSLNNLANLYWLAGDLEKARKMFDEAIQIDREVGRKKDLSMMLIDLGSLLSAQGNEARARASYQEALATGTEASDKETISLASAALGSNLYKEGNLVEASKLLNQSEAAAREMDNKEALSQAERELGIVLLAQGDLAASRNKEQEASKIQTDLGSKGKADLAQLTLARIEIEEGHPGNAEAPCRKAIADFQAQKEPRNESLAHLTLANVLLAMGRVLEAEKEVKAARLAEAKNPGSVPDPQLSVVAGRVDAALGKNAEARKAFETVLAEATTHPSLEGQLEARLALGDLEMNAGKAEAGRAQLAALEKEAAGKGFLLIARKAHADAAK